MRHFAYAAFVAAALSFAGCAQFDAITTSLSSPQATQAAQNVGQYVKAFACGLSAAAATAQGIEGQTYSGAPLVDSKGQQITEIVYASSSATCRLLGGVLASTTAQSVPASIVAQ